MASYGEEYSFGENAEDFYDRYADGARQGLMDKARELAQVTVPAEFPPEGYRTEDDLPGPNSSEGAGCLNNLASNLMLAAFPPGRPMLRYNVLDYIVEQFKTSDPEVWAKTVLALSRLERSHRSVMETTPLRSAYIGFLKQLLLSGNCLWRHIELAEPSFHRLDQYVVKRSSTGVALAVCLKETITLPELERDVREFVEEVLAKEDPMYLMDPQTGKRKEPWEVEVDIYSCQTLREDDNDGEQYWCYWQEFRGHMIDGTDAEVDYDVPPLYAAWIVPVYGSNWGRSYCEDYRGDLIFVDRLSSSVADFAAIAAWMLLMVDPSGLTNRNLVMEADNMSVLAGRAEDVQAMVTHKGGDMAYVNNVLERVERRLDRAFLRYFSIQRQGERVTAEEWKRLAGELDKQMGGIYSQLAQGPQRHVVMRFVALHEENDPKLPVPDQDIVKVAVVTGLDALGQTTEEEALVDFAARMKELFEAAGVRTIDVYDWAIRYAAEKGIQPEGLIKTVEEVQQEIAQERQAAVQAQMVEKGTGPVATEVAKSAAPAITQQIQQQQQTQGA